jgi:conjugative relaxase-like TrwC/TraI family protein
MLRITPNNAADRAKSYYSTSDYYSEGQELIGRWKGQGAERLGLDGSVEQKDWDALCDNRDPFTGKLLTARQKQNRRVGYDCNFHAPKSLSLLYGLTQDERILDAFRDSVDATMADMEAEMKTRVRAGGRNEDRTTGNLAWGEFVHFTARPVDGLPDPHLHAHCFAFNTTWDEQESRWKAGQFGELKRDAPFFEAVFHSRLARRLEELGLAVERTKHGWEIRGIPDSAIQKFSRRTALIEEKAREQGITDAEIKGELGAKTRERKRKDLSLSELRQEWLSRLTADEAAALEGVQKRIGEGDISEDGRIAGEAIARALSHCFEHKSVVPERTMLTEALKRSYGAASLETVHRELYRNGLFVAERKGRRFVSSQSVLREEMCMTAYARKGRGTCRRLGPADYRIKRDWLNADQRRAVQHVIGSRDRIISVSGKAGVGKTSMMQEAVEGIEETGRRVFTFAPSADASGVLREAGFENASTVARLLIDQKIQGELKGHVIWIDEAGQLGTTTMGRVFDLAAKLDARVILSGDRHQHGSVERGAALRLLEEHAGIVPAEIREIQRQKGDYKEAVRALSEGSTEQGFNQLDQLGWIHEVKEGERYKRLARDYVATVEEGKTALVVSPTHREGNRVTDEIRTQLKSGGRLESAERQFQILQNANLTEADRAESVNYAPGDIIVFHQNAKGFTRGQRIVAGQTPLPLDQAERFQVFHTDTLSLAPGDLIRITRNGATADGKHRLDNGRIYQVKSFTKDGDIVLKNGWTVEKSFGHIAYGYVVTSHASQGKTVDHVFIGQSSDSFPASSREQFYVSASRGREKVTVYTDDKEALLEAVKQTDERLSATELVMETRLLEMGDTLRRLRELMPESHPHHISAGRETRGIAHEL